MHRSNTPHSITSSTTARRYWRTDAKRLGGLEVDVRFKFSRSHGSFILAQNSIGSSCNKHSASETQGGYQPIDEAAQ
jgi:hypothetical protein